MKSEKMFVRDPEVTNKNAAVPLYFTLADYKESVQFFTNAVLH